MWWTLTIGSPWQAAHNILFSVYSIKYCFYVVFQAIGVYFNLYFLIPRFLEKGYYLRYLTLLLITILVTAALIIPGYYVSAWLSDLSFEELFNRDPRNFMFFFQINTLPSTVASVTLGMSVKLAKNWVQAKQKEQTLEKEKLETELKFLKSQINPHFLFNTINSIFVLIHKNPQMASESLAKFSDLLRYQLYECNEHEIPLDQELTYLENFIELQKLRQDHNYIELSLNIEQRNSGNLSIAPFVLMPFIENAFKHVSQQKDKSNWIRMNLRFDNDQLLFNISNSFSKPINGSSELIQANGIGLKNVQRRLDLMYPGNYKLSVQRDDVKFKVNLQLSLRERVLTDMTQISIANNL
ncbi:MAG: sensor histidine kinase [Marivirga sp.]|nr:sensor histidine kinase [Marivirga sp.]